MDETQKQDLAGEGAPALSTAAHHISSEANEMPTGRDAAQLAGILLPQEHVVFGSRPHPVVFIRPAIGTVIAFISTLVTLVIRVHPIVRGHHVTLPLVSVPVGALIALIAVIFTIVGVMRLAKASFYYHGFRVVATNRRVFVKSGVFGRSVRPIGNAATSKAGLTQDFFGRKYDYGTIHTNFGALHDMREPVPLYRAIQAVANGVQGDNWAAPTRHTYVP